MNLGLKIVLPASEIEEAMYEQQQQLSKSFKLIK